MKKSMELELLDGASALVIVAHPDDETIWVGGTLLLFPSLDWTIFSLCRGDDADRAPKFKRVCDMYGAKSIMTTVEDDSIMNIQQSIPEIENRLRARMKRHVFDYVFTHGANGEYGHPRHIGVHRAVKRLVEQEALKPRHLFYFSYRADKLKKIYNKEPASFYTITTPAIHRQKRNIIKQLYGFSAQSFENKSCLAKETFSASFPEVL